MVVCGFRYSARIKIKEVKNEFIRVLHLNAKRPNDFGGKVPQVPRYDDMVLESRLAKLDAASPFDLQYNPVVKGYIDLYTIRRRELVSRMMALSQFYFPMFEEQLDKYNLPLELKNLAICESALNPLAKSRAGAGSRTC